MKKWFCTFIMVVSVLLVGCGKTSSSNDASSDEPIHIGVLQYAEHEALTKAREGFVATLKEAGYSEGENVKFTILNAQGDQSQLQSMSEKIAKDQTLNFVIATPAAQTLLNIDSETPTVFTAVTDPVAAGLVDSLDKPNTNATGATDLADVEKQIALLLEVVPNAKKVGILYNSSEVNSQTQVDIATKALKASGIEVDAISVNSTNDVQQAALSLAKRVDAIYLPTDNTVASTISVIGEIVTEYKIPTLGAEEALSEGALVTYGVDYYAIGQQAGELAVAILQGKKPEELPVTKPEKPAIVINEEMAKVLEWDIEQLQTIKLKLEKEN